MDRSLRNLILPVVFIAGVFVGNNNSNLSYRQDFQHQQIPFEEQQVQIDKLRVELNELRSNHYQQIADLECKVSINEMNNLENIKLYALASQQRDKALYLGLVNLMNSVEDVIKVIWDQVFPINPDSQINPPVPYVIPESESTESKDLIRL